MVDHGSGPLLVLAGPGTGKTTTLVESVAARIARDGDPERILVLTFSRKAAVELRDRMALRIGAARAPQATTFHSFCYALVRAHQDSDLFVEPLRLLSGPEQDVAVRGLLAGQPDLERLGLAHVRWPDELRASSPRAASPTRSARSSPAAGNSGSAPTPWRPSRGASAARTGARRPRSSPSTSTSSTCRESSTTRNWSTARCSSPGAPRSPSGSRRSTTPSTWTSTRTPTPRRCGCCAPSCGGGRTLVAFGDPDQSIYTFRGADVNGILDFPDAFPRANGRPAPVEVLGTSRRSGAVLLAATRLLTQRMPLTRLPAEKVRAHRELSAVRDGGHAEVYTYPTSGTELANIADILRRAHLEDGVPWGEMAVLVRAGSRTIPTIRRALTSAGVPLDIDGDDLPLRHEPAVAPLLTALRAVARAESGADGMSGAAAETRADAPDDADAPEVSEGSEGSEVSEATEATEATEGTEGTEGEDAPEAAAVPEVAAVPETAEVPEALDELGATGVTGVTAVSGVSGVSGVIGVSDGAGEPEGVGATEDPESVGLRQGGDPREGTADAHDACWLDTETALTLLASPLASMDAADLRRLGRALREEERAAGNLVPPPSDDLLARALAEPERLVAHDPAYARGPSASARCCARRVSVSRAAGRPRRPSGTCGRAHRGRSAWSGPPGAAARPDATPTGTSTPCARCSRPPGARRSAREAVAP